MRQRGAFVLVALQLLGYKIDTTLGRHEAEHIWAPWPCHSGHPQLIADAGVTAVKAEAGFFNEL